MDRNAEISFEKSFESYLPSFSQDATQKEKEQEMMRSKMFGLEGTKVTFERCQALQRRLNRKFHRETA